MVGVLHDLYKPVPGKFKDYIALPKPNGYQSLHTVLFGPFRAPIEFQIRTQMMDAVAESGIAAHWVHKTDASGGNVAEKHTREWIRGLLEMQTQAGDSIEFLENVKVDLFPKEIYVYTPAGDIKALPRGSSPVDLAYAVHTEVGNTCVAAKVDGRLAPLRSPLANGQTVEVVTAAWGRPSANWLDFVVTGKARASVRSYLKRLQAKEAVELGRRLLSRSLALESLGLEAISPSLLAKALEELHLSLLSTCCWKRLDSASASPRSSPGASPPTMTSGTPNGRQATTPSTSRAPKAWSSASQGAAIPFLVTPSSAT